MSGIVLQLHVTYDCNEGRMKLSAASCSCGGYLQDNFKLPRRLHLALTCRHMTTTAPEARIDKQVHPDVNLSLCLLR